MTFAPNGVPSPPGLDTGAPLVIGGTGGSGTRAVKRMVDATGRFMGANLNASEDALDLVRFDWNWGLSWLEDGASNEMRAAFAQAVERHIALAPSRATTWGRKHPHSYLLLAFLDEHFPRLRFVHVVRDGRDIALSTNQNQLYHYGKQLLADSLADAPPPIRSLGFWGEANLRAADYGEGQLGERYLRMRFEDVCSQPAAEARRVVAFAGGADASAPRAAAQVHAPADIGRGAHVAEPREIPVAARLALERFGYL